MIRELRNKDVNKGQWGIMHRNFEDRLVAQGFGFLGFVGSRAQFALGGVILSDWRGAFLSKIRVNTHEKPVSHNIPPPTN